MFNLDKWIEILNGMIQNPFRSFLTMNAIGIGIFILVILQGLGGGLQNGAKSSFDDATNTIWVNSGRTSRAFGGFQPNRRVQMHLPDYDYAKEEQAKTNIATARLQFWGSQIKYGNKVGNFTLRCVHPGHQQTEMTEIGKGRYINEGDIKDKRKVAVIGMTIKKELFQAEDAIGKMITVRGVNHFVVGVFDDPNSRWENRVVYTPISTGMLLFGGGTDQINNFIVSTEEQEIDETELLAEDIDQALRGKYAVHPEDARGLNVRNNNAEWQMFENMFLGIKIFMFILGFFTLLAGVIGVSTVMSIVVQDRTKEIGVRKAIGATPTSIISMIIQESFFITFISGLIGFVLAYIVLLVAAEFVEHDYFKNPTVNLEICMLALIVLTISGIVSGLIPALKAAKIKPVEALKDE